METLTLYSSIKKELMQQQLVRGSAIAVFGAIILVFGGTWVPQNSLAYWGLPLFLVGIGLITWGMLPYRKLKQLEEHPYVVKIENGTMHCFKSGREVYQLHLEQVKSVEYVDDERHYGIKIAMRPSESLFLPYFSKHSFEMIKSRIEPDHAS